MKGLTSPGPAGQSRAGSLFEAATNVAAGFVISFGAQGVLYPALGVVTTQRDNLVMAAAFTALSIVRSYLFRRMFNWRWRT